MIARRDRDRLLSALIFTACLHVVLVLLVAVIKVPEYHERPHRPAVKVDLGPTRPQANPNPAAVDTPTPQPAQAPQTAAKPTVAPSSAAPASPSGRPTPAQPGPQPATASPQLTPSSTVPPQAVTTKPTPVPTETSREVPPVVFQLPVPRPVTASSKSTTAAPALNLDGLTDLGTDGAPTTTNQAPATSSAPVALEAGTLRFSGQMAGRGPLRTDPPDFTGMTPGRIIADFKVDASGIVVPGSIKFHAEPAREIPLDVQISLRTTIREWTFTPAPEAEANLVAGQITFTIVRK